MSTTCAYFDCFSGASGDMLLASLLDAGLCIDDLRSDLAALGLQDYAIDVAPCGQHGITGSCFSVTDTGNSRPARNLTAIREIIHGSALDESVQSRSLAIFERLAVAEAKVQPACQNVKRLM